MVQHEMLSDNYQHHGHDDNQSHSNTDAGNYHSSYYDPGPTCWCNPKPLTNCMFRILFVVGVILVVCLGYYHNNPRNRTVNVGVKEQKGSQNWPNVGLRNLSVSNLDLSNDDVISASWLISLDLKNVGQTSVQYTDATFFMAYCGDSSKQLIVDSDKLFSNLVLRPGAGTTVYLCQVVEKLSLNKMALNYMTMDVIGARILEFNIVVKVGALRDNTKYRYIMSCEGVKVSISDSDLENGAGFAKLSPKPRCDLAQLKY